MNLLFLASATILVWAACSALLMGVGSLVLRSFSQESHPVDSFCFGSTAGILEIYQLFRPIDFLIFAIFCLVGTIGFVTDRLLPIRIISKIRLSGFWVCAGYVVLLCLTAFRSSGRCDHVDTGLYGAPAVNWLVTFLIVLGLANLHGRLGFNSSFFLLVAAIRQGISIDLSYRIMEGLFIALLAPFVLGACSRLLKGETNCASDWFLSILLVPLAWNAAKGRLVGTNTDLPAMLLCFLAAYFLFSVLEGGIPPEANENMQKRRLLTAMLLSALGISFKLSMVLLASLGWTLALTKLQFFTPKDDKRKLAVLTCFVTATAILIPWILRSFILSGYPFFPNSSFGIHADWSVPKASVDMISAGVRSWARMPNASFTETAGTLWVRPWLEDVMKSREGFSVPVVFFGIGALLLFWKSLKSRNCLAQKGLLVLLPSLAGLIFWCFQAPLCGSARPRFG
jgi:hypothetical protein